MRPTVALRFSRDGDRVPEEVAGGGDSPPTWSRRWWSKTTSSAWTSARTNCTAWTSAGRRHLDVTPVQRLRLPRRGWGASPRPQQGGQPCLSSPPTAAVPPGRHVEGERGRRHVGLPGGVRQPALRQGPAALALLRPRKRRVSRCPGKQSPAACYAGRSSSVPVITETAFRKRSARTWWLLCISATAGARPAGRAGGIPGLPDTWRLSLYAAHVAAPRRPSAHL